MAISARLSRTLHQKLGDEGGEDLVTWMMQVEGNRSELSAKMDAYLARTDARFDVVDARFEAMSIRLENAFALQNARMEERFAVADAKADRRVAELLRWSLVFWVGAVGAIAALARLLR
jgi:hypothetical protein